jgi:hypothetical protein
MELVIIKYKERERETIIVALLWGYFFLVPFNFYRMLSVEYLSESRCTELNKK